MVRLVLSTVARVALAGVWLVSGSLKALDPEQTYLAVQAYDLLPGGLTSPVAAVLPFLELTLGALLLLGLRTRAVAVVSAVVLLAFVGGLVQAWARGLTIDCGCFSGGGEVDQSETSYPQDLARDLGFLLLAGWLIWRPRTVFALDRSAGPGDPDVPGEIGASAPAEQTTDR